MKNFKQLFVSLCVSFACLACMVQSAYASIAGHVQFVNGNVQIINLLGQTHPAHKGDVVNEGDTMTSAPAASAQIKMMDGGFVAMRPDTRLKFDKFVFSGKQDGNEKSFFSLFKGGFRAITGLIGQLNKQNYRINTAVATIGIRGTDHETVLVVPDSPLAQAAPTGVYSKVNVGETTLTTNKGTINVMPNQMGFAGGMDQAPKLQPLNTNIFTVAPAPTQTSKADKSGDKNGGSSQGQGTAKGTASTSSGQSTGTAATDTSTSSATSTASTTGGDAGTGGGTTESVRPTAVVDAVAPNPALIVAPVTTAPPAATPPAVTPPAAPTTVLNTAPVSGGTTVNITTGTATTPSGAVVPVTSSIYSTQAQAAADAALLAANAAANASTLAGTSNTSLLAVAQVSTAPATTVIGNVDTAATLAVNNAANNVASANAITLTSMISSATANASTAQTLATTAASKASAAQTAFTNNGTFADSTAVTANNLINNPTTGAAALVQNANALVQSAATTVTAQNTALTTAQTAATTALSSATSNLSTANADLNTGPNSAATQNAAIGSAQGSAAALLAAASNAAALATSAATAAQAAATLAASYQAAGDLINAQAQLANAQAQLLIAQNQQAAAQKAQTDLAALLSSAQAAQTAASTAVTNATNAANTAATSAGTASTQAGLATTANSNAISALGTSNSNLTTVQSNALTVATYAPIAAYNNPAYVGNFLGHTMMSVAATGGGFNLGESPNNPPMANTTFVLDGNGNLVEARSMSYQTSDLQFGTGLGTLVSTADIKWVGGTAADTFMLPDHSIYGGRWVSPIITVTDNSTSAVNTYNPADSLWAVLMAPTVSIQSLVGTFTYTKAGNTTPFDSAGVLGTLNSATLSANFTAQVVSAAIDLTMGTGTSTMAGDRFVVTGTNMPINPSGPNNSSGFSSSNVLTATCTGTCANTPGYSANLGGSFAGLGATSAGLAYNIWPTITGTAPTPVTDLVQGLVAFTTTATPSAALPLAAVNYNAGFIVPVAYAGGFTAGRHIHSPITGLNILVDAAGNLVGMNGTSFEEPYGTGTLVSIASANVSWTGTPTDLFKSADGNITMGRYQGGSVSVTDLATTGAVAPFSIPLTNTSSVWGYSVAPTSGYVQSLAGTSTYTVIGNTTPFDSLGGLGTLSAANSSLTANFTNQTVKATVNLTMNSGTYSGDIFNAVATMPLHLITAPDPSGFKVTTSAYPAPVVTCTGCTTALLSPGALSADMSGTFAGATATDAMLGYSIWATTTSTPPADIISGLVAFNNAGTPPTVLTGGPFAAYAGGQVAVEYVATSSGLGTELVVPSTNVTLPVTNAATTGTQTVAFSQSANSNNGFNTITDNFTVVNPATVTTAGAGIQFAANTLSSYSQTTSQPMGGNSGAPPQWIVGPQAYLDAYGIAALPTIATLNYSLDGGTLPIDTSGKTTVTGTLNSTATFLTANVNLTTMTVNANIGIIMNGTSYLETSTMTMGYSGANYAANQFGGTATVTGGACTSTTTTCGGTINGAFTGQNYAGALLSYNMHDSNAGLNNITGVAALTLTGGTNNTNGGAIAISRGAAAPTGNYFVGSSYGIQQAASVAFTTAGVLNSFSSQVVNGTGISTTVTCTTCTATNAISYSSTGISYGTWDQGTYTDTFTGSSGTGSLGTLFWITGPETTPVYLAQVLTNPSVAYTYANGAVGDTAGNSGTITSASLTANFTNQTIAISLAGTIGISAAAWSASTPNALLGGNCSGSACFNADSYRASNQAGYLTVVIDGNSSTGSPNVYGQTVNGQVSGQLVGSGLTGAILSLNLNGPTGSSTAPTGYENIQGVAAFSTATVLNPMPYRLAFAMVNDPLIVNGGDPMFGDFQNSANVKFDALGNLMQLNATASSNNTNTSTIVLSGGTAGSGFTGISTATGTPCSPCSDPVSGIQWGRWSPGVTATVTDLVTPANSKTVTVSGGGVHWLSTPTLTGPVTMPTSGTYTYTLAGGTNPTDSLGNVGTLNSATLSLSANLTTQTVNAGVNVSVGTVSNIAITANNVPINSAATFSTDKVPTTITCTAGCATNAQGVIRGGFIGNGAVGAAIAYGFLPNPVAAIPNMITGVAAFHR